MRQAVSSVFQFSRNFEPSAFGEKEIFVITPTAGQLLLWRSVLDIQFDVTNANKVQFTSVVEIDGEVVAEFQNDFAVDPDAPGAGARRVSSVVHGIPPGCHLLRIVVYSDGDDAIMCETQLPFETAEHLPFATTEQQPFATARRLSPDPSRTPDPHGNAGAAPGDERRAAGARARAPPPPRGAPG